MTQDCSFHVTLRREALRRFSIGEDPRDWCEFSGSVGEFARIVDFPDESLAEITGSRGAIRFSVPRQVLPLLGHTANHEDKETARKVDGK